MKTNKPTLHDFLQNYDCLNDWQKAKTHFLMAWHLTGACFKHPSRELLRVLWEVIAGLIWPDLQPLVLPALIFVCVVLAYVTIGGRFIYTGELVGVIVGAGSLAGAMAGRLASK